MKLKNYCFHFLNQYKSITGHTHRSPVIDMVSKLSISAYQQVRFKVQPGQTVMPTGSFIAPAGDLGTRIGTFR